MHRYGLVITVRMHRYGLVITVRMHRYGLAITLGTCPPSAQPNAEFPIEFRDGIR